MPNHQTLRGTRMRLEQNSDCCGITELIGVERMGGIEAEFLNIGEECFASDECPAFIFFSTTTGDNGTRLQEFISKHNFGEVKKMRARVNPNTGNEVTMWTWGLNKKTFKLWWMKNTDSDFEDEDETA